MAEGKEDPTLPACKKLKRSPILQKQNVHQGSGLETPFSEASAPCFSGIIQEIAVYLPDKDLMSFSLAQRETLDAVVPANAGHWRQRFRGQFDLPPGTSPATIKSEYIQRKCCLTRRFLFKNGQSLNEIDCLRVIRQLILEVPTRPRSSSPQEPDASPSFNVRLLWRFMKNSSLLHDAFRYARPKQARIANLLQIVQVFFFGWNVYFATHDLPGAYPFALRRSAYAIHLSEAFALALPKRPLVDARGQIDFSGLSHLTNLWKFHLATNSAGTLHDILRQLPPSQHPNTILGQSWLRQRHLGMRWKGALCEYHQSMNKLLHDNSRCPPADCVAVHPFCNVSSHYLPSDDDHEVHTNPYFTGGDRLLDLTFKRVTGSGGWPAAFEKEIPARFSNLPNDEDRYSSDDQTPSTSPDAGHPEEKLFFGTGEYDVWEPSLNHAGVVHPLPAQGEIPGWQQFTMVSYETPASGSERRGYLDANEVDLHVVCRYEGIMLPGDSIIIGRYSLGDEYRDDDNPKQPFKQGTFIYWLVRDEASDEDGKDEAGNDEADE
ncbi:MAG: hypothetical protein Q9168_003366 [Polycauliona sp. 1 TL-2023]